MEIIHFTRKEVTENSDDTITYLLQTVNYSCTDMDDNYILYAR